MIRLSERWARRIEPAWYAFEGAATPRFFALILAVLALIAIGLAITGCESPRYLPPDEPSRLTSSHALELIQADALSQWCRAEVDGEPVLKAEWQEGLRCGL